MNTDIAQLQHELNKYGAKLVVDGVGGPATRAAILTVFRNTAAPAIDYKDELRFAARLGGTVKQLRTVARVEAPRGGYDKSGLLTALFERHYAFKRWQVKIPLLSDPAPGGYTVDIDDDGINDSWEKLADLACRKGIRAFECASFGKFQIMGAWWEKLNYASPLDFVWQLSRSEAAHYEALVRYIEIFGLRRAFCRLSVNPADCIEFAQGYNGPGFRKYSYHIKLAAEMQR